MVAGTTGLNEARSGPGDVVIGLKIETDGQATRYTGLLRIVVIAIFERHDGFRRAKAAA